MAGGVGMTSPSSPSLFVFGMGYTARALARALQAEGWRIAGTTRSAATETELAAVGIEPYRFARERPLADPAGALAGTTHLLSSIPPDELGDPVLERHLLELERCRTIAWAGYLGTTGVYGDQGGAWVDEATPIAPTMARTRQRAAAEGHWLASGLPVQIFRLAGIYGPGRSALDAVRAGTARRIVKPGQTFGRIHVDDIVQVLRASIARPNPGAIYNLADDEPAAPEDVVAHAARLLGVPPPPAIPFEQAELSPMAQSFYRDHRRVSNGRIKQELGVVLRHPNFRDGLQAILEQEPPAGARETAL